MSYDGHWDRELARLRMPDRRVLIEEGPITGYKRLYTPLHKALDWGIDNALNLNVSDEERAANDAIIHSGLGGILDKLLGKAGGESEPS